MRRSTVAFVATAAAAAVGTTVMAAWTLFSWPGAVWVDDLGEGVAAWIGALACARAAWRHGGRGRVAWALMGASAVSWGAGEAVWSWYELHLGQQVPFPSPADAGFLGAVPLAVAAALLFPGARRPRLSRLASVLDGLVVACGLFALSWVTVLHAVYAAGADTLFAEVLSLAYPVGDVLIATMLITLVLRMPPGEQRLPLVLLIAGLGASAVSDSSFAYLTAQGTFGAGNVLDAGWVAGYLLLALGGVRAAQRPAADADLELASSWWRLVLPFAPMAATLAVSARQVLADGALEPLLFWLLVGLIGLVVWRQFLALAENHALLRRLGDREAEMRHRAFHDPLTDLPNRALFRRRVNAALQPAQVGRPPLLALLVIDLDDFKDVNDTLGHGAGDEVLVEVGCRLRECVRPSDTVARLGGDEFAVLVQGAGHPTQAEQIAVRVVSALHHTVDVGRARVRVQASVGLALARPGEVRQEELLRRADVAMYRAKGDGKGRSVTYEPEMDHEVGDAFQAHTA